MRRETRGSFSDHHRVHRFQLFGFKSMAKNMKKDEKGKVYLSKYYDYDYVERRIFPSQSSSIYIYIYATDQPLAYCGKGASLIMFSKKQTVF